MIIDKIKILKNSFWKKR